LVLVEARLSSRASSAGYRYRPAFSDNRIVCTATAPNPDRAAREAEDKEYQRQHRKALKKNKPERDRLRALKDLRFAAEYRIEVAIDTAARAVADRKYPSPGRDRNSAFVDAYRDLTHKVYCCG
jgi:hypothetical protein